MAPARVVPAFDEVDERGARLGRRREACPLEEFTLHGGEEALAEGVVVGVAHRAHRGPEPCFLTPLPVGDRGVVTTMVGMMDHVV
jgi:hypothetical protein